MEISARSLIVRCPQFFCFFHPPTIYQIHSNSKANLGPLYPVLVEPCEEGGCFASCSLLQGCRAEGQTYGEAIDNIKEVIQAHLGIRQKHNEIVPSVRVGRKTDLNIQFPVPINI